MGFSSKKILIKLIENLDTNEKDQYKHVTFSVVKL